MEKMRIRKHRAWHKESKQMLYAKSSDIFKWSDEGQPIEVMDFVGLHDKNGKEIYEGDIIFGYKKGSNSDRNYKGFIEWQTEQAGWIIRCNKYVMEILSLAMEGDGIETRLSSFEVIGNIYETPHLLTPQN